MAAETRRLKEKEKGITDQKMQRQNATILIKVGFYFT